MTLKIGAEKWRQALFYYKYCVSISLRHQVVKLSTGPVHLSVCTAIPNSACRFMQIKLCSWGVIVGTFFSF